MVALWCLGVSVIAVSPRQAEAAGPRIVEDDAAPEPAAAPDALPAEAEPQPQREVSSGEEARAAQAWTATKTTYRAAVVHEPRVPDLRALELGMQGGILYDGNDYVTDEALYGGAGFFMRWRMSNLLSLATSFDMGSRSADDNPFAEVRFSADLGLHVYFLDDPVWQPFAATGLVFAGGTVTNTTPGSFEESSYDELGGYAGAGLDVLLDDWVLTTQLRAIATARLEPYDGPTVVRDNYTRRAPDGRGLLQWSAGFGYRF